MSRAAALVIGAGAALALATACGRIIGVAPGRPGAAGEPAAPSIDPAGAGGVPADAAVDSDVASETDPSENGPGPDTTEASAPAPPSPFSTFEDRAAWSSFDLREVDPAARSFQSSVFDGRFLYFAPFYGPDTPTGAPTRSGLVLRHDTRKPVDTVAAWEKFELSSSFEGTRGFCGGVFDGRFVYLVPCGGTFETPLNAKIVRIDTRGSFRDPVSWTTFDVNAAKLGNATTIGFGGAAFDGRYVYFAAFTSADEGTGLLVRYDTQSNFVSRGSWQGIDLPALTGDPLARGYNTAGFDGRYLYLVPLSAPDAGAHGRLARFDARKPFGSKESWEVVDLQALLGMDVVGFWGAIFDGRYMYFPPHERQTAVRFDTRGELRERGSYSTMTLDENLTGFSGGGFDGRYVYFAQAKEPAGGPVLRRYDTQRAFDSSEAWASFRAHDVVPGSGGFAGAAFDGTSIFFAPPRTGHLLRFRARRDAVSPFPVSSFY